MKILYRLSAVFCFYLISLSVSPQTSLFDRQMQVGFEEKQGQYADLDVKLINEEGDTVLLRDMIDKPVILNLAYYECPGTCSPLMWGISRFIDAVDLELGRDYKVLTISFDPDESFTLGKEKKASYLTTMKKKDAASGNWLFFVSDSASIARLTKSVGFHYEPFNNQYIHPTGLIALASDGKIIRYLRGIDFLPFDIKITLVEAAEGKIGPSINRLLAVCYSYDNTKNEFVFNVTKVSAIVITFILLLFFIFLAFSRLRRNLTSSK
ncbi:MAG: SCO family protein [Bacteroidales bacterium]|nr:SCO family protein [Bacteroidales bacterium]